jgi:uncharacterized protein (DUF1778 family)
MKRTAENILGLTESRTILEQTVLPWEISETMALTRRESLRLMELIGNPKSRNEKFRKAMADYTKRAAHLPDGTTVIRDSE